MVKNNPWNEYTSSKSNSLFLICHHYTFSLYFEPIFLAMAEL